MTIKPVSTKPLTEDELAIVRYVRATDPPATEPTPPYISDSLRRILESPNPVDTLRNEYRYVAELCIRREAQPGDPEAGT